MFSLYLIFNLDLLFCLEMRDSTFATHHIHYRHCRRCGAKCAVVSNYHVYLCRRCFAEVNTGSNAVGFVKYH